MRLRRPSAVAVLVAVLALPAGASAANPGDVAVHADLNGLQPGTTYHYRLVVTNPDETAHGGDSTFETASGPPPFTGAAIASKSATVKNGAASISVAWPQA